MKIGIRSLATEITLPTMAAVLLLLPTGQAAAAQEPDGVPLARRVPPLPIEHLKVQGLRRDVRFYRPARLAENPSLVIVLHGGGGDGERFRRLTDGAFDQLAEDEGILIAYPDALGGQWNGCRRRAPYHSALEGIDELAFLRSVVRRAEESIEGKLSGVFVVDYSNGGHLVFRLALEDPGEFDAFATIGAHLPAAEDRDCTPSGAPVPMFLISGTADPINPWGGGDVRPPGGGSLGRVLSAERTATYFLALAGSADGPTVERHEDLAIDDGVRLETYRWAAGEGTEILLMKMNGGGHTLPYPTAKFPAEVVGRTSRDLDGARAIWDFFARHRPGG